MICALIFALALSAFAVTATAQHTSEGKPFILVSSISINSPTDGNCVNQPLMLNVTVKSFIDANKTAVTMQYSIDGEANITLSIQSTPVPIETEIIYPNGTAGKGISVMSYHQICGYATLPELSEGTHNVTVYARYDFDPVGLDSRTVNFTVNKSTAYQAEVPPTGNSTENTPQSSGIDPVVIVAAVFAVVLLVAVLLVYNTQKAQAPSLFWEKPKQV